MSVPLESIRGCLEGVIPSIFATCSADGVPNVTYLSIVQYVDSERVAVSFQFLNKSRANLLVNPNAQMRVVEPATLDDYALDLRYLHTETDGPVFAAMRDRLEAVAEQSGLGDTFRLRGADVHRVVACRRVVQASAPPALRRTPDQVDALDELIRRLGTCCAYEEAARTALQALEDLFDCRHAILFAVDERGDRLFAIAANGYPGGAAGAEVPRDAGLIGIAASRRHVVCDSNLVRSRVMGAAVRASTQERGGTLTGGEIPLPGLASARSAAAVPLVAGGALTGLLYLESEAAGRFGARDEQLLRVVGAQVAASLALLETTAAPEAEAAPPPSAVATPSVTAKPTAVTYYQADDSVFVDGEYVVRGVPGRILWRLLEDHAATGRTSFTNRELRLDERLGLPAGADNLEARLLVLRRRLDAADGPVGLERVGRGRLELRVAGVPSLSEIVTSGPMRAAHASDRELGSSA